MAARAALNNSNYVQKCTQNIILLRGSIVRFPGVSGNCSPGLGGPHHLGITCHRAARDGHASPFLSYGFVLMLVLGSISERCLT